MVGSRSSGLFTIGVRFHFHESIFFWALSVLVVLSILTGYTDANHRRPELESKPPQQQPSLSPPHHYPNGTKSEPEPWPNALRDNPHPGELPDSTWHEIVMAANARPMNWERLRYALDKGDAQLHSSWTQPHWKFTYHRVSSLFAFRPIAAVSIQKEFSQKYANT